MGKQIFFSHSIFPKEKIQTIKFTPCNINTLIFFQKCRSDLNVCTQSQTQLLRDSRDAQNFPVIAIE